MEGRGSVARTRLEAIHGKRIVSPRTALGFALFGSRATEAEVSLLALARRRYRHGPLSRFGLCWASGVPRYSYKVWTPGPKQSYYVLASTGTKHPTRSDNEPMLCQCSISAAARTHGFRFTMVDAPTCMLDSLIAWLVWVCLVPAAATQ
eukprot:444668-Pleurochrysis_carterae.AAC.6